MTANYAASPYRPSWAVGITNQELVTIAQQEGANPYQPDWADSIDRKVITEARAGAYKNVNAPTKAELLKQTASEYRKYSEAGRRKDTRMIAQTKPRTKRPALTPAQAKSFDRWSASNATAVAVSLTCACEPYEDVFTFKRWIALGRVVKRGQHGIKLPLVKEVDDDDDPTTPVKRILGYSTVFCRCQTEPLKAKSEKGAA